MKERSISWLVPIYSVIRLLSRNMVGDIFNVSISIVTLPIASDFCIKVLLLQSSC